RCRCRTTSPAWAPTRRLVSVTQAEGGRHMNESRPGRARSSTRECARHRCNEGSIGARYVVDEPELELRALLAEAGGAERPDEGGALRAAMASMQLRRCDGERDTGGSQEGARGGVLPQGERAPARRAPGAAEARGGGGGGAGGARHGGGGG